MGVVGLEEDPVVTDRLDHAGDGPLLEEPAPKDLAAEVLAGLQLEVGAFAPDLGVLEGVVGGLEDKGQEADPALHRHELQLREPGQDPRHEQVGDLDPVVEEQGHGRRDVGGARTMGLHASGREPFGEVAAADMERHRQARLLHRGPERVPMGIAEVGQVVELRLPGEQHPPMTRGRAPLHLRHRGRDVPERGRHDREQATRIGAAPLEQEVVVRADARQHQLRVAEPEELLVPEAGHVRIQRLGPDPDRVQVLEPGVGLPRRERDLVHVARRARERLRPARDRGVTNRDQRGAVGEMPGVATGLGVPQEPRPEVAEPRREPGRPDVAGLGHVGVDIDHPFGVRHRAPLLGCWRAVRARRSAGRRYLVITTSARNSPTRSPGGDDG